MLNKATKLQIIVVTIVATLLLVSCSANNNNNYDEIQMSKEQVDLLSTQNALLAEPGTTSETQSNSGDVQAPPPPLNNDPGTQIELVTPTPDSLPSGPVPAGEPIFYQGWGLTVSKELTIFKHDDAWGITIFLRNMDDTKRIFRFKNSGITARDNLGNVYEMSTNVSVAGLGSENCEVTYHSIKNVEVRADTTIEISSGSSPYTYCSREDGIHVFQGPIPFDVSQLIIHFDGFGPYTNVDVTIDL